MNTSDTMLWISGEAHSGGGVIGTDLHGRGLLARGLHAQNAFRIEMGDLFPVGVADRQLIQEVNPSRVRLKRPVDGKKDVVGPKRQQRAYKRRLEPVPARCDNHVVSNVLYGCFLQTATLGEQERLIVHPVHSEWQAFTIMPENDLEIGVSVEYPGEDQAQEMASWYQCRTPTPRQQVLHSL